MFKNKIKKNKKNKTIAKHTHTHTQRIGHGKTECSQIRNRVLHPAYLTYIQDTS